MLQGYKTEKRQQQTETPNYSLSQEYLHRTQHTATHNNRQHAGLLTQYPGKYSRMDTWPRYNEATTPRTHSEVLVLWYTAVDLVDNIELTCPPARQRAYLKHPVLFNMKTVIFIGNVHSITRQRAHSCGIQGFSLWNNTVSLNI